MHREPDVGFDPGSPGSRPGSKPGAKPLHHPGIPIYLFMRHTERGRDIGKREEQAPCGEPDVGLDLRTPGSRTELKAGAQPLSHPEALNGILFYFY